LFNEFEQCPRHRRDLDQKRAYSAELCMHIMHNLRNLRCTGQRTGTADGDALRFHWMTRSLVWIQSARGDGHDEVVADAQEPWTGSVEAEHRHEHSR
jgi:hypothetical protein